MPEMVTRVSPKLVVWTALSFTLAVAGIPTELYRPEHFEVSSGLKFAEGAKVSSGSGKSFKSEKSPSKTAMLSRRFHRAPQTAASPTSGTSTDQKGIHALVRQVRPTSTKLKSKTSQQDYSNGADTSPTSKALPQSNRLRGFRTNLYQLPTRKKKDPFLERYNKARQLDAASWHAVGSPVSTRPPAEKKRIQRVAQVKLCGNATLASSYHVRTNTQSYVTWQVRLELDDEAQRDPALKEIALVRGPQTGLYTASAGSAAALLLFLGPVPGSWQAAREGAKGSGLIALNAMFHLHRCGQDGLDCSVEISSSPICFEQLQRVPDRMLCDGKYDTCLVAKHMSSVVEPSLSSKVNIKDVDPKKPGESARRSKVAEGQENPAPLTIRPATRRQAEQAEVASKVKIAGTEQAVARLKRTSRTSLGNLLASQHRPSLPGLNMPTQNRQDAHKPSYSSHNNYDIDRRQAGGRRLLVNPKATGASDARLLGGGMSSSPMKRTTAYTERIWPARGSKRGGNAKRDSKLEEPEIVKTIGWDDQFCGPVLKGFGDDGSRNDYPTANLVFHRVGKPFVRNPDLSRFTSQLRPLLFDEVRIPGGLGLYMASVTIADANASNGSAITALVFNDSERKDRAILAHLLNYKGNLYGKELCLHHVERIPASMMCQQQFRPCEVYSRIKKVLAASSSFFPDASLPHSPHSL